MAFPQSKSKKASPPGRNPASASSPFAGAAPKRKKESDPIKGLKDALKAAQVPGFAKKIAMQGNN